MENMIGRMKTILYLYFPEEHVEAGLEISRWTLLFVISWFITEMMNQINLVPDSWSFSFLWFTFNVPVQGIMSFTLALAGRYIDKRQYVQNRLEHNIKRGALPF